MTHPNWFADDAETTGTIPAAPAVDPDPVASPTAKLRAVATAVQSTLLPPVHPAMDRVIDDGPFLNDAPPLTAGPGPLPAELSNPAMEPHYLAEPAPLGDMVASDDTAEVLHALACACPRIDDLPRHQGYDFHELGDAFEARIRTKVIDELLAGYTLTPRGQAEPADPTAPRHAVPAVAPVEAKVSAGAWGALAASLGVALGTALLQNLDVLPSLLGGDHPWVGALVTGLGVALPPLVGLWRGYQAPHSPRCEP